MLNTPQRIKPNPSNIDPGVVVDWWSNVVALYSKIAPGIIPDWFSSFVPSR